MADLGLEIEKGAVETEVTYIVKATFIFTENDLKDLRPLQMTKKQLFDAVSKKNEGSEAQG